MLSAIVDDPRLIAAAQGAVRVIIRRPHAYKFKDEHARAPIPGLVVLDADGKLVGVVPLPAKDAVERVVELLAK